MEVFVRRELKRCNVKSKKKIRHRSAIKSLPKNLSSLLLAYQLTKRVSKLGFDWPNLSGVLEKLDEETKEFREALSLQNRNKIREEIGDLLFVLVNIARVLRINPEEALKKTVKKFNRRFQYIEKSLQQNGKSFHQSNLIEMDLLWEEAKKREKGRSK
jgi:MazG family protein